MPHAVRYARLAASMLLVAAGTASAQLLPVNENAGFDQSLAGWTTFASTPGGTGSITWSPVDADGTPGSGSALLSGPPGTYFLWSCDPSNVFWSAPGARTRLSAVTSGGSATLVTSVEFLFTGDLGEIGCVGPSTQSLLESTRHLASNATVSFEEGPERARASAPLVSYVVQVIKRDDADVRIDDAVLLRDVDFFFASDFE